VLTGSFQIMIQYVATSLFIWAG